jgi:phage gpG-like protein
MATLASMGAFASRRQPMVLIKVNTVGANARLAAAGAALAPEAVLKVIGLRFMSFVDESFRTSGRGKWAPLRPSTIAGRREGSSSPLQDTGKYRMSFTGQAGSGFDPTGHPPITDGKTYVQIGTESPLKDWHERGTKPYTIRARNKHGMMAQNAKGGWVFFGKVVHHPGLPARPVLPTRDQAATMARDTVAAMLDRVIANANAASASAAAAAQSGM